MKRNGVVKVSSPSSAEFEELIWKKGLFEFLSTEELCSILQKNHIEASKKNTVYSYKPLKFVSLSTMPGKYPFDFSVAESMLFYSRAKLINRLLDNKCFPSSSQKDQSESCGGINDPSDCLNVSHIFSSLGENTSDVIIDEEENVFVGQSLLIAYLLEKSSFSSCDSQRKVMEDVFVRHCAVLLDAYVEYVEKITSSQLDGTWDGGKDYNCWAALLSSLNSGIFSMLCCKGSDISSDFSIRLIMDVIPSVLQCIKALDCSNAVRSHGVLLDANEMKYIFERKLKNMANTQGNNGTEIIDKPVNESKRTSYTADLSQDCMGILDNRYYPNKRSRTLDNNKSTEELSCAIQFMTQDIEYSLKCVGKNIYQDGSTMLVGQVMLFLQVSARVAMSLLDRSSVRSIESVMTYVFSKPFEVEKLQLEVQIQISDASISALSNICDLVKRVRVFLNNIESHRANIQSIRDISSINISDPVSQGLFCKWKGAENILCCSGWRYSSKDHHILSFHYDSSNAVESRIVIEKAYHVLSTCISEFKKLRIYLSQRLRAVDSKNTLNSSLNSGFKCPMTGEVFYNIEDLIQKLLVYSPWLEYIRLWRQKNEYYRCTYTSEKFLSYKSLHSWYSKKKPWARSTNWEERSNAPKNSSWFCELQRCYSAITSTLAVLMVNDRYSFQVKKEVGIRCCSSYCFLASVTSKYDNKLSLDLNQVDMSFKKYDIEKLLETLQCGSCKSDANNSPESKAFLNNLYANEGSFRQLDEFIRSLLPLPFSRFNDRFPQDFVFFFERQIIGSLLGFLNAIDIAICVANSLDEKQKVSEKIEFLKNIWQKTLQCRMWLYPKFQQIPTEAEALHLQKKFMTTVNFLSQLAPTSPMVSLAPSFATGSTAARRVSIQKSVFTFLKDSIAIAQKQDGDKEILTFYNYLSDYRRSILLEIIGLLIIRRLISLSNLVSCRLICIGALVNARTFSNATDKDKKKKRKDKLAVIMKRPDLISYDAEFLWVLGVMKAFKWINFNQTSLRWSLLGLIKYCFIEGGIFVPLLQSKEHFELMEQIAGIAMRTYGKDAISTKIRSISWSSLVFVCLNNFVASSPIEVDELSNPPHQEISSRIFRKLLEYAKNVCDMFCKTMAVRGLFGDRDSAFAEDRNISQKKKKIRGCSKVKKNSSKSNEKYESDPNGSTSVEEEILQKCILLLGLLLSKREWNYFFKVEANVQYSWSVMVKAVFLFPILKFKTSCHVLDTLKKLLPWIPVNHIDQNANDSALVLVRFLLALAGLHKCYFALYSPVIVFNTSTQLDAPGSKISLSFIYKKVYLGIGNGKQRYYEDNGLKNLSFAAIEVVSSLKSACAEQKGWGKILSTVMDEAIVLLPSCWELCAIESKQSDMKVPAPNIRSMSPPHFSTASLHLNSNSDDHDLQHHMNSYILLLCFGSCLCILPMEMLASDDFCLFPGQLVSLMKHKQTQDGIQSKGAEWGVEYHYNTHTEQESAVDCESDVDIENGVLMSISPQNDMHQCCTIVFRSFREKSCKSLTSLRMITCSIGKVQLFSSGKMGRKVKYPAFLSEINLRKLVESSISALPLFKSSITSQDVVYTVAFAVLLIKIPFGLGQFEDLWNSNHEVKLLLQNFFSSQELMKLSQEDNAIGGYCPNRPEESIFSSVIFPSNSWLKTAELLLMADKLRNLLAYFSQDESKKLSSSQLNHPRSNRISFSCYCSNGSSAVYRVLYYLFLQSQEQSQKHSQEQDCSGSCLKRSGVFISEDSGEKHDTFNQNLGAKTQKSFYVFRTANCNSFSTCNHGKDCKNRTSGDSNLKSSTRRICHDRCIISDGYHYFDQNVSSLHLHLEDSNDEDTVLKLHEMGYPLSLCHHVVRTFKGDMDKALQWLLDHDNDELEEISNSAVWEEQRQLEISHPDSLKWTTTQQKSIKIDANYEKDINAIVESLKNNQVLQSSFVEKTFIQVPRTIFVPEILYDKVCTNSSLKLIQGFYFPSPKETIFALEALALEQGLSFLEVGLGTGYITALVTNLLGSKSSVDCVELEDSHISLTLANWLRLKKKTGIDLLTPGCLQVFLQNIFIRSLEMHHEDGVHNCQYDRVYVGAACMPEKVEQFLLNFVKVGGILVVGMDGFWTSIYKASESNSLQNCFVKHLTPCGDGLKPLTMPEANDLINYTCRSDLLDDQYKVKKLNQGVENFEAMPLNDIDIFDMGHEDPWDPVYSDKLQFAKLINGWQSCLTENVVVNFSAATYCSLLNSNVSSYRLGHGCCRHHHLRSSSHYLSSSNSSVKSENGDDDDEHIFERKNDQCMDHVMMMGDHDKFDCFQKFSGVCSAPVLLRNIEVSRFVTEMGGKVVLIRGENCHMQALTKTIKIRNGFDVQNRRINATSRSFGTTRANVCVRGGGKWFYEVKLQTNNIIQIGWVLPGFSPNPEAGHGVGDDSFSWAYDGCRKKKWHGGLIGQDYHAGSQSWKAGDVVGCMLDLDVGTMAFMLNGANLGVAFSDIQAVNSGNFGGYSPACSMACGEHVTFNLGSSFQYPPPCSYFPLLSIPSCSLEHNTNLHYQIFVVLPQKEEKISSSKSSPSPSSSATNIKTIPCPSRQQPQKNDSFRIGDIGTFEDSTTIGLQLSHQSSILKQMEPVDAAVGKSLYHCLNIQLFQRCSGLSLKQLQHMHSENSVENLWRIVLAALDRMLGVLSIRFFMPSIFVKLMQYSTSRPIYDFQYFSSLLTHSYFRTNCTWTSDFIGNGSFPTTWELLKDSRTFIWHNDESLLLSNEDKRYGLRIEGDSIDWAIQQMIKQLRVIGENTHVVESPHRQINKSIRGNKNAFRSVAMDDSSGIRLLKKKEVVICLEELRQGLTDGNSVFKNKKYAKGVQIFLSNISQCLQTLLPIINQEEYLNKCMQKLHQCYVAATTANYKVHSLVDTDIDSDPVNNRNYRNIGLGSTTTQSLLPTHLLEQINEQSGIGSNRPSTRKANPKQNTRLTLKEKAIFLRDGIIFFLQSVGHSSYVHHPMFCHHLTGYVTVPEAYSLRLDFHEKCSSRMLTGSLQFYADAAHQRRIPWVQSRDNFRAFIIPSNSFFFSFEPQETLDANHEEWGFVFRVSPHVLSTTGMGWEIWQLVSKNHLLQDGILNHKNLESLLNHMIFYIRNPGSPCKCLVARVLYTFISQLFASPRYSMSAYLSTRKMLFLPVLNSTFRSCQGDSSLLFRTPLFLELTRISACVQQFLGSFPNQLTGPRDDGNSNCSLIQGYHANLCDWQRRLMVTLSLLNRILNEKERVTKPPCSQMVAVLPEKPIQWLNLLCGERYSPLSMLKYFLCILESSLCLNSNSNSREFQGNYRAEWWDAPFREVWLRQVSIAHHAVSVSFLLMKLSESLNVNPGNDFSWIDRRDDWLRNVMAAATIQDVARLLLPLEHYLDSRFHTEIWGILQQDWRRGVKALSGGHTAANRMENIHDKMFPVEIDFLGDHQPLHGNDNEMMATNLLFKNSREMYYSLNSENVVVFGCIFKKNKANGYNCRNGGIGAGTSSYLGTRRPYFIDPKLSSLFSTRVTQQPNPHHFSNMFRTPSRTFLLDNDSCNGNMDSGSLNSQSLQHPQWPLSNSYFDLDTTGSLAFQPGVFTSDISNSTDCTKDLASTSCFTSAEQQHLIRPVYGNTKNSQFLIRKIIIRQAEKSQTPCTAGLVFIFQDYPTEEKVEALKKFDFFTPGQYQNYLTSMYQQKRLPKDGDPIAFWDIGSPSYNVWGEMFLLPDLCILGSFVVVKLLRSQHVAALHEVAQLIKSPNEMPNRQSENFDRKCCPIWICFVNGEWTPYPEPIQYLIESQYQDFLTDSSHSLCRINLKGRIFQLNLQMDEDQTMYQYSFQHSYREGVLHYDDKSQQLITPRRVQRLLTSKKSEKRVFGSDHFVKLELEYIGFSGLHGAKAKKEYTRWKNQYEKQAFVKVTKPLNNTNSKQGIASMSATTLTPILPKIDEICHRNFTSTNTSSLKRCRPHGNPIVVPPLTGHLNPTSISKNNQARKNTKFPAIEQQLRQNQLLLPELFRVVDNVVPVYDFPDPNVGHHINQLHFGELVRFADVIYENDSVKWGKLWIRNYTSYTNLAIEQLPQPDYCRDEMVEAWCPLISQNMVYLRKLEPNEAAACGAACWQVDLSSKLEKHGRKIYEVQPVVSCQNDYDMTKYFNSLFSRSNTSATAEKKIVKKQKQNINKTVGSIATSDSSSYEVELQLVLLANRLREKDGRHASSLLQSDLKESLLLLKSDVSCSSVFQKLFAVPFDELAARFDLLRLLNEQMAHFLPFVTIKNDISSALSATCLSVQAKQLLFLETKIKVWENVWSTSLSSFSSSEVVIVNRYEAARLRDLIKIEKASHRPVKMLPVKFYEASILAQLTKELWHTEPFLLRRADGRSWFTKFQGEPSIDDGGLYRETLSFVSDELVHGIVPLFIPCSNGINDQGENRSFLVPNHCCCSFEYEQWFEFVGRLMGIVTQNLQNNFPVNLAPIVWKQLLGEDTTLEDLAQVDLMTVKTLNLLRCTSNNGPGSNVPLLTKENFDDYFPNLFFSCVCCDGKEDEIELIPNGKNIPVTYERRLEYADCLEQHRLNQFQKPIQCIRRGLDSMIPSKLLPIFTWQEVELLICGRTTIDLELLKRVTEYSQDLDHRSPIICRFWRVLNGFSVEQQQQFLQFVWGRSRLPFSEVDFGSHCFKIERHLPSFSCPDKYLPVVHTCFFQLELPDYSSDCIMREKLLYAMYNCASLVDEEQVLQVPDVVWGDVQQRE